ncbi:hypothetical protein JAAARDRAFT_42572 [Jaapia argillacea MUCL 33604]|uniref:Amidase domain-containing protein n=1 Tax=Jaapia argillacea MUCL 33604 TaxID=933084 RepID=A0A067P7C7_9AGAM|nr:hypothetical protein JAAARDRAFT_42572 [Jaapia argillacea MUCL 33604]
MVAHLSLPSSFYLVLFAAISYTTSIKASSPDFDFTTPDPLSLLASPNTSAPVFEPRESTIASVHHALFNLNISCHAIVQSFLDRIEAYDKQGPAINAIITTNPNAPSYADELDAQLAQSLAGGGSWTPGKLFCVPTILKDNYDTFDMPTTGGSLSLKGAQPSEDADVVKIIRDAGAVILAKANMHEFAIAGLTISSILGQTKNPYDLTRTPGGSSSGTGASLAASYSVLGTGTDTVNSICSPTSANSLVGICPSRGLITRSGILPLSYTQDAIGPLARTVRDAAVLLGVMASAGWSRGDNVSALGAGLRARGVEFEKWADKGAENASAVLGALRIGVPTALLNDTEADPEVYAVNKVFNSTISLLQSFGSSIISIPGPTLDINHLSAVYDVQVYEFRSELDSYLSSTSYNNTSTPSSLPKSLAEILTQNLYEKGDAATGAFMINATLPPNNPTNPDYISRLAGIDSLRTYLSNLFAQNNLDVLFYPHQSRLVVPIGSPSQIGRNGLVAALSGYPAIGVPGGFSEPSGVNGVGGEAGEGVPVGVEFMGRWGEEGRLVEVAAAFEKVRRARRAPGSTWGAV